MRTPSRPGDQSTDRQPIRYLLELLRSLATELHAVAARVEDVISAIETQDRADAAPSRDASIGAPLELIDRTTFTVAWKGKSCYLGCTILFRLIERLARNPNHLVAHQALLDGVWNGPRSGSAIRNAVASLRSKLVAAEMPDLAGAIDSRTRGHLGLMLRERT